MFFVIGCADGNGMGLFLSPGTANYFQEEVVMTGKTVADGSRHPSLYEIGEVAVKQTELMDRFRKGGLVGANTLCRTLQVLIEGQFDAQPFRWEVSPHQGGWIVPSFGKLPYHSCDEQLCSLRRFKEFSGLDASHVPGQVRPLPYGAEGCLLIPKPLSIAKSYSAALDLALRLVKESWPKSGLFWKSWDSLLKFNENNLRLCRRTEFVWHNYGLEENGDFWYLPVQLGDRHWHHSCRYARARFNDNEFGLGPYEAAIALLLMPERLNTQFFYPSLGLLCAGCDYQNREGEFHNTLWMYISDQTSMTLMSTEQSWHGDGHFAAITGFLPHPIKQW